MENFVYYGMLFSIYKELLSDVSKEYYNLYYEENLTLQEIAELKNVSKSYVGHIIKKTSQKLTDLENKLHIYENKQKLNELLECNDLNKIKEELKQII